MEYKNFLFIFFYLILIHFKCFGAKEIANVIIISIFFGRFRVQIKFQTRLNIDIVRNRFV